MKGITTALLNVREKGHLGAKILGRLPVNAEVEIISKRNGWGRINYNEQISYVCLDFVTLEEEEHNADN